MKTLRGITSLDRQFTGQYRWLFRNLGLLILIIVALAAAAVVYFDKRQVEDLSHKLMTSTAATMVEQIVSFFETVDSNLRMISPTFWRSNAKHHDPRWLPCLLISPGLIPRSLLR